MNESKKPIDEEDARRAAENYILDRYPYSRVVFQTIELKTSATQQIYEFTGYSNLSKWPKSTGIKKLCQIQVDAHSADIIGYSGV